MELVLSSEASKDGFHFPGDSSILSKLIPYLQLWARQWNFKGKLLSAAIPAIWFVATS